MKKIFPLTIDGAWWRGTLSVLYNFRMVAKIIGLLLLLANIGFGLYWLGISVWEVLKLLWSGICWLCSKWQWWLVAAVVALFCWLLSKLSWRDIKWPGEDDENWKKRYNWLWLLLLLLLLGGGFWLFRSCFNTEKAYDNAIISKAQYSDAFDWVATTLAYLDGDSQG